jgi:hypothetical protein
VNDGGPSTLRAGPLSLLLDLPDVRYVRLGDQELVRRITMPVRDAVWDTVAAELSEVRLDVRRHAFEVVFAARNMGVEIDFAWRGRIAGSATGAIEYELEGQAQAPGLYRRIGICVLHPIRGCAGSSFRALGPEGQVAGTLPDVAGPQLLADDEAQPLFPSFSTLTIDTCGIPVHYEFDGDLFEMEDQRNWADASFKTYPKSPPARPDAWELLRGVIFRQRVRICAQTPSPPPRRPRARRARLELEHDFRSLLRLGLGASSLPSAADAELIRAARPAHLRVDVPAGHPALAAQLAPAVRDAAALGCRLEIALLLGDDPEAELRAAAPALEGLPVAHLLVLPAQPVVTEPASLRVARDVLLPRLPAGALLGGGTNAYLCELNRVRPAFEAADAVAYSVNPQVHAYDDLSLVETPDAVGETVRTVRSFSGEAAILVTPITLRPRFNADAPESAPPDPDPRQSRHITAAWTLAVIAALVREGAASATFFETAGPRGIVEAGTTFPVHRVLTELADSDGMVAPLTASDPLACSGVAFRRSERVHVLAGSLLATPQQVKIAGVRATVELPPYGTATVPLPRSARPEAAAPVRRP